MLYRKIIYLVLVLTVFLFKVYYAVYFPSALLAIIIIMPIFLVILLFIFKGKVSAKLNIDDKYFNKGDVIKVKLEVDNSTPLPISRVDVSLAYENKFNEIERNKIKCSLSGNGILKIDFNIKVNNCGVMNIKIESIKIYDYLSLFSIRKNINLGDNLIVLPNINYMEGSMKLLGSNLLDECDDFSESISGEDNSQVFNIREYIPGDKIQRIHWKLSSKYDDLMVKEYSFPLVNRGLIIMDFIDTNVENKGEILDSLIETVFSISNFYIENSYIHYLCWYDIENNVLRRELISDKNKFLQVMKEALKIKVYKEACVLKHFNNIYSGESYEKVIYITTKVHENTDRELKDIQQGKNTRTILIDSKNDNFEKYISII